MRKKRIFGMLLLAVVGAGLAVGGGLMGGLTCETVLAAESNSGSSTTGGVLIER